MTPSWLEKYSNDFSVDLEKVFVHWIVLVHLLLSFPHDLLREAPLTYVDSTSSHELLVCKDSTPFSYVSLALPALLTIASLTVRTTLEALAWMLMTYALILLHV